MYTKFALALVALMAHRWLTISAETPIKSAPYPAAGWRPRKPFQLPNDAFSEAAFRQQQPQISQTVDAEINKERVDFAGQIQGNSFLAGNQPQSAYLPPNTNDNGEEDSLRTQGLPNLAPSQFFTKQTSLKPQPNFRAQTQQPNIQTPAQEQQHIFNTPPELKERNFRFRTQSQEKQSFRSQLQPQQNFKPQLGPQQENAIPQQQLQFQQYFPPQSEPITDFGAPSTARPAQQYGAPGDSSGQFNVLYPDPRSLNEPDYTAIEALNAAVDAYNRAQAEKTAGLAINDAQVTTEEDSDSEYPAQNSVVYPFNIPSSRYQEGQYYILGPDNGLQRVRFTTTQDDEEAKTNGFTAKLKYMPAGEIRDPIFKYNERGQLVRILRK